MFEAVTVPSLMMMTSIVSEESLARDRRMHARTHTHTHTHTDTHTHTHTHSAGTFILIFFKMFRFFCLTFKSRFNTVMLFFFQARPDNSGSRYLALCAWEMVQIDRSVPCRRGWRCQVTKW